MWFTYILYSEKLDRFYIGYSDNIAWRLERHNQGWGRYTKGGIPWRLVYSEAYELKKDAMHRERQLKQQKSRKFIEHLIANNKSR